MLSSLYDIVVSPLVCLIELVFTIGYRLTGSPGLAVIGVSLAVNLLCLPLYRMADAAQADERDRQASMKRWVDHINASFSGDERVMMLQTYYRLRHYRPSQALIGSLSLLLQIPFFMAAYSYLSGLSIFSGAQFMALTNLGAPDALIHLGGMTANVMPLLMTALNCISTAVYTRGLPMRDKAQAYGLALVFLVLLYDSPSGLVLYWTLNQIFSLAKNIFMKVVPEPRRWALILAQVASALVAVLLAASGRLHTPKRAIFVGILLVVLEAILFIWRKDIHVKKILPSSWFSADDDSPLSGWSFILGAAFLVSLLGAWIPSALISDSPTEFADLLNGANPLDSMRHAFCTWTGVLLWLGVYYALSQRTQRNTYVFVLWYLSIVCLINYLMFGRDLGMISNALVYDITPSYTPASQLANLALLAFALVAAWLVWARARQVVTPVFAVMLASTLAISAINMYPIIRAVQEDKETVQNRSNTLFEGETPKRLLHLSKDERNVVVLFLDRAISGYLPYIMAERPELQEKFDGFTYYPNSLSFGINTMFSAPSLYGGYEYTVDAINKREDVSVADKHNEAMLLMPTLFSQEDYQTTVVNPPYAGSYTEHADLSLYDDVPNTHAYDLVGAYTSLIRQRYGITTAQDISRSLIFYALFKVSPVFAQPRIYDGGNWLSSETSNPPVDYTLSEFAVLDLLPEITTTDDETGGFILLHNELPHTPGNSTGILQLPDYLPANNINNAGLEDFSRFTLNGQTIHMDTDFQLGHYHDAAASLIQLGEWFDWLRKQQAWDNTRIVLVSDHGFPLDQFDGWRIDDRMDIEMVNPLLMVKDFDASGFTTSDEFMTIADTPIIAMEDIVDNPTNPFTGKAIDASAKRQDQIVESSTRYLPAEQKGNTFITDDAPWYSVHDNVFDLSNWKRYETFEDVVKAQGQ